MNQNAQLDLHPDAESLNAFAEQALDERERGQIVAHLAVCSRCRQVVYLAQVAAAEVEPALAAAAAPSVAPHRSWFRSWWFVWAPTAALAAIVALAFYVHARREQAASEMAQVVRETTPAYQDAAAKQAMPPTSLQAAPAAKSSVPAKSVPAQPTSQALQAVRQSAAAPQLALSAPAAAPPVSGANDSLSAARNGAAPAAVAGSFPQLNTNAEYRHEAAVDAWQNQQLRGSADPAMQGAFRKTEQGMASQTLNESAKREETDRLLKATAPAAQLETAPAAAPTAPRSVAHGTMNSFALYRAKPAGLPSGLPAVSTATAQHSVLAVDRAGSVFLSEDSGVHWQSVARQWNGRAVAVRTPAVTATDASGTGASPAPLFELVNGQGQLWVSADGKIWKAK